MYNHGVSSRPTTIADALRANQLMNPPASEVEPESPAADEEVESEPQEPRRQSSGTIREQRVEPRPVAEPEEIIVPEELRDSSAASRVYITTASLRSAANQLQSEIEASTTLANHYQAQRAVVSSIITECQSERKKPNSKLKLDEINVQDANGQLRSAAEMLAEVGLSESFLDAEGAPSNETTLDALMTLSSRLGEQSNDVSEGLKSKMIAMQEVFHKRDFHIQLASKILEMQQDVLRNLLQNIR